MLIFHCFVSPLTIRRNGGQMIRSMTGYGLGSFESERYSLKVEIKAVNHRFFEVKIRVPSGFRSFEKELASLLKGRIARGTVTVNVSFVDRGAVETRIAVNEVLAGALADAAAKLSARFGIEPISTRDLIGFPEVVTIEKGQPESEDILLGLKEAFALAMTEFDGMREIEGAALVADMISLLDDFDRKLGQIVSMVPDLMKEIRDAFEARVLQLASDRVVDGARLAAEIAIQAEKCDINEEIVRMRSHVDNLRKIFDTGGDIGKKLDFYLQEMNREVTTSLSKLRHPQGVETFLGMKEIVEKLREQTHNIE